ncbi:MAG: thioredoxin-disulfide reductase [Defluviitaleaceae bacterium]|nr:thioredoxin-disulfide reductase [Defluviitaleaceae bacterium]
MEYDVIIIGAGPCGVTSAIYCDRAGLKTLVLEKLFVGGQIVNTYEVENYPALGMILGVDLVSKFESHLKSFEDIDFKREEVISINALGELKEVNTKKNTYKSKAIIFATGSTPRYLGVPGEERLKGMGVSYCGTCDGAMFRKQDVLVVGGGNTAVEDAIFLSRLCNKVYVVHRRDTFRADKKMVDNMLKIPNIEFHYDSVVEEICGENSTDSIIIKNINTNEKLKINVNCIFIAIGQIPNNNLIKDFVKIDDGGYAITDDHMKTNVDGFFVAGDGRAGVLKQIITAASDGAIAAFSASKYIAKL